MSNEPDEVPFTFECQGARLVGMLHRPARLASTQGVLFVVPGGPQTRTGVCRNLVLSSRRLAELGIVSMRFEQRGVGDSGGRYLGFEFWEDDLRGACEAFRARAPDIEGIVLWGECNAASAVMMNAWRLPDVTGIIMQNPLLRTAETQAKALIKSYYWRRLRQKSFWLKVFQLQFMPWKSLRAFLRLRASARAVGDSVVTQEHTAWNETLPFQAKMLEGLQRFHGSGLLFLSSRNLDAVELGEIIKVSPAWKALFNGPRMRTVAIKDGVHKFDSRGFREKMVQECVDWLHRLS
jgi:exosortase A-associated hydrolase 1